MLGVNNQSKVCDIFRTFLENTEEKQQMKDKFLTYHSKIQIIITRMKQKIRT